MSVYLTSPAVILSEAPFRENDLQLVVYTPVTGLTKPILRSGRLVGSKLRPHVLTFDQSFLTLASRGQTVYVTQAALTERLRRDNQIILRQRAAALAATLAVWARPEESDLPQFFKLLEQCFKGLNKQTSGFLAPLLPLLIGTLSISGIKPQFNYCGTCRGLLSKDDELVFSISEGTVFHQNCRHPVNAEKLASGLAEDLQIALAGRLPARLREVFSFLLNFAKYHLEARRD